MFFSCFEDPHTEGHHTHMTLDEATRHVFNTLNRILLSDNGPVIFASVFNICIRDGQGKVYLDKAAILKAYIN